MPLEYEDALAFLQTCQSTGAGEGSSVYEHLTRLIGKLLEEQPKKAVDLLETSLLIKRTEFDARESSPLVPISSAADAAKANATANLFANPDLPIDPLTGEPKAADTPNDYEGQDVMGDALLFDALGVGLGLSDMYGAMLAMKKLGDDPLGGIKTVRFFGKMFGLYSDYYVFEATLKTPPEIPAAPEGAVPYEANSGANQFVYYVCSYLGGPFTRLPFVQPEHIKAARQIKKFLTGRLDSPVSTYPVFPGTEANYLRAQIARISCTTVCAPSGALSLNDETNELEKSEDWEGLPGREAMQLASWVHKCPHLKKQGRCAVYRREPPEGSEEEIEPTEEEEEEGPELLGGLDADNALGINVTPDTEGATPSWTGLVSSAQEAVKYQVGGLRSNLWPGAYVAAKDKQFSNIYVGWGVKNAAFVPLPPPPVATEFDLGLVETTELPLKPAPEPVEGEEQAEE